MASNQQRNPLFLGALLGTPSGGPNLGLNAAATWLAYSFVPDTSKTLNTVRAYVQTKNGTLAAGDVSCDIYSDNVGKPNVSLGSTTTVSPAIATNTWCTWSGLSVALTASTMYWIVFKNLNGTPATNFPAFAYFGGNNIFTPQAADGSTVNWGWSKVHTLNSGTAWATSPLATATGYRVGYSDGSYDGYPVAIISTPSSAAGVYLTREAGVTFVTPSGPSLSVRGLGFGLTPVGAPTGNVRYRLYNGTTLLGTTQTLPNVNLVAAVGSVPLYFASPITIGPGTVVRATVGVDGGGSSSNYVRHTFGHTVDNDANSKQLLPFAKPSTPGNQVKSTYFDGTTWTDTDTTIYAFGLLLDSDNPFAAAPPANAGVSKARIVGGV